MKPDSRSIIVVGGGGFGAAAALELRARGWRVTLTDPGPLPHPDASSTDVSKAVRMDYGADLFYTELADRAIDRWHEWNDRWDRPLYHESGFLVLGRERMAPGSFEGDCFELLCGRGQPVERVGATDLVQWPAWRTETYVDGYINRRGGWAESGEVVRRMLADAREAGVRLCEGTTCERLLERGSVVTGIVTGDGERLKADRVLIAAGAWTPGLLSELEESLCTVGQPVLLFRPADPHPFSSERFPVWAADIANTGWYGFPATADGLVKVGNHGPGERVDPRAKGEVGPEWEARFREFVAATFPALADAPLARSRVCLYCDSRDGDFWIDHHPDRPGLVVAAGGSGHGFKFVTLLGAFIADVIERRSNPTAARFAWRAAGAPRKEQARHEG